MEEIYIGVDVGGTNVKIGGLTRGGSVAFKQSIKTDPTRGAESVASDICEAISALGGGKVAGVGVGVPGLIDSEKGEVVCSGNLGWEREDFATYFRVFGAPVKIANDANVAALGEARFGAAKGMRDCVLLTLGTGVGSGIIIGGKIFAGVKSAGAEIGHMVIEAFGRECTCGGRGCFEAYASASALKAATAKKMLERRDSAMWEIGDISRVSGKTAFCYAANDQAAREVVESYLDYLSIGIVNVANIFRPEAIILGGGVSNEGERLAEPLRQKLKENVFAKGLGPEVKLLIASLRNDAGFMGAAALNMEE